MEAFNNTTATIAHNHSTSEGGFLTGRNPFLFNVQTPLPTFIVQLMVIVIMSRLVKLILSPIRQPAVIAEIISGIILGPTAFGHIPHYTDAIFPKPSLPFLNLMSNFGLVLFLFLVGLELDPKMLKKSVKQCLSISLAGMALPFAMGAGVSYGLYTLIEPPDHIASVSFVKYFLFLGVAMAITAFPVLARILTELNLLKTKVGSITISAAAVDDATSWCLLALVISLINAGSGYTAIYVFLIAAGYTVFILMAVRPVYIYILRRSGAFNGEPSQMVMFMTLSLVFISAFITDSIGIHAIFGGFLAGIMMPHEGGFAYHITEKLEDIVAVIFLPLYFALSGLKTQIGSLNDATSWGMVVLVILVACFGKIAGCTIAARVSKLNWRESFTVGVLMNCKGLVELIVLNLGYDANIISQKTFAIMVIMALVTTFLTVPLVRYLYPSKYHDLLEYPNKYDSSTPSLLVSVDKIEQVPQILSIVHLLESKQYSKKISTDDTMSITSNASSNLKSQVPCVPKKKDSKKDSKSSNSKLVVNCLRLIEITERDSSVMLQTSQDALKDDPVMKMINTFGDITSLDIRGLVKVVTMSNFAESLINTANQVNATYVIVPWTGVGSLIDDISTPIQQLFYEQNRRKSIHTPAGHANFLQDLLSEKSCAHILVLVNRGLEIIPRKSISGLEGLVLHYQQIFLPFFGGEDDRQALNIVMGLVGKLGIKVKIVRFKNPQPDKISVADSDLESGLGSDDCIISTPEPIVSDSLDHDIIHQYFGNDFSKLGYVNFQYTEVQSFNPIASSLELIKELDSRDLVIVGRESLVLCGNFNFRGADIERRKILGDIAESVLISPSSSSLLVVQAKRL